MLEIRLMNDKDSGVLILFILGQKRQMVSVDNLSELFSSLQKGGEPFKKSP